MSKNQCFNCKHELNVKDKFCPECGQKNKKSFISAKDMLFELMSSMFNIDSKVINTVRNIFVPGKLTTLYFEGKRSSHSNPVRIYLFMSFFLFAMLSSVFNQKFQDSDFFEQIDVNKKLEQKTSLLKLDSLSNVISSKSSVESYKKGSKGLLYLYMNTHQKRMLIDSINGGLNAITYNPADSFPVIDFTALNDQLFEYAGDDSLFNENSLLYENELQKSIEPDSIEIGFLSLKIIPLGSSSKMGMKDLITETPEFVFDTYGIKGFWNKLYLGQMMKIFKDPGNAALFVLSGFSWVALFFIPLTALFLKLLYLRRKRFYVEHLIFTVHTTSFLFLLLFITLSISYWTNFNEIGFILLYFPIYLWLAMKKYYQQNYIKTLLKYLVSNAFSTILIVTLVISSFLIRMLIF
jgi:hypothetical protein